MEDFELIYETRGKAKEYAPLGVELYTGCSYGCKYCFVPETLNISVEEFHTNNKPVNDALNKLKRDAELLKVKQDDREIFLCFHSDPYQRFTEEYKNITGQAIEILVANDLRFTILTKSGLIGTNHFDLLRDYEKFSFGTTLIFTNQDDANTWEPNAAKIAYRIEAIAMARNKKIKTWVSLEPVIDPQQALELIPKYHSIVDHWKIGKINYHPEIEAKVDWIRFREEVKFLLGSLGADYYLKKSLTDFTDPDSQKKDIKMATKTGTPIVEGKITKPESPLSENDIKIIPGNKRILLIAPHGVMGDDDNTNILTFEVRKRLECYAIVNDVFQRDIMNFNSFASASSHPEFIKTIKEVADTPGYTLVVWIHGIKDANAHKEAKAKGSGFNGEPKDLRALIGYGQGPNPMVPPKARTNEDKKSSPTATKKTTTAFHDLLINKGMPTILTRDKAKKYRGREPDNMNQWFLKEGYNFEQVESLQLEIRETPTRLKENIAATAEIIANTLSELVPLVKEVAESIDEPLAESITVPEVLDEVEDKVDDVLVDRAYQWLADRFRKHITNFVIEAGRYMIDTFYEGNPRAAFAKNKTKEQPPSLKRLMEKIQQTSNSPSESAPSTGWLYNAVNFAAHEAICKQEGFQTFGILGHSHKFQLLHVPKLKQIEIDKFNEAIKPAFQEKERHKNHLRKC